MGVTISVIALTSVGALAAGWVVRCHRKLDDALSRLGNSLALD